MLGAELRHLLQPLFSKNSEQMTIFSFFLLTLCLVVFFLVRSSCEADVSRKIGLTPCPTPDSKSCFFITFSSCLRCTTNHSFAQAEITSKASPIMKVVDYLSPSP